MGVRPIGRAWYSEHTGGSVSAAGRPYADIMVDEIHGPIELNHAIIEGIGSGLLVLDEGLRVVTSNQSFRTFFDIPGELTRGTALSEALGHDSLEKLILQPIASGRHVREIEYSHEAKCGDQRQFLVSVSQIVREPCTALVVVIFDEITEWKRRQFQVMEASRLVSIGEMVAGAAHEINNPLAAVMGFAQLILRRALQPSIHADVERILGEATRVSRIVANLQSFAHASEPSKERVDLVNVVHRVLELKSYELRIDNIDVVMKFEVDSAIVMGDQQQIEQVVLNIAVNAGYFMKGENGGGTLTISLRRRGRMFRLEFTDNGPGIRPEYILKVFDPFFTTKDVGSGTGLGLSICYGIVGEHGGTITVASAPGEGATFAIELEADEAPTALDLPTTEPVPSRGQKVLVVDDEPLVAELISRALSDLGLQVLTATDGSGVIDRVDIEEFDIIILDFKMPEVGGAQLFEQIESMAENVASRVLFITGDIHSGQVSEIVQRTGNPVLRKPFVLEDLIAAVVGVAERRKHLGGG